MKTQPQRVTEHHRERAGAGVRPKVKVHPADLSAPQWSGPLFEAKSLSREQRAEKCLSYISSYVTPEKEKKQKKNMIGPCGTVTVQREYKESGKDGISVEVGGSGSRQAEKKMMM